MDTPDLATGDPLADLHRVLDRIDEVAVADRVAVFERANRAIADDLATLDEI
jgi:hypothetical protein